MNLSCDDLNKLHEQALTIASRAGAYIQSRVGEHRETNFKAGGNTLASQVVTEVDLESQRLILDGLRESMDEYRLGLLTEESEDDSSRFERENFWCIDPLDGTLSFVEGKPGYSVSIALVSRSGEPLIGVIHDPVNDTTFHAFQGGGCHKNDKAIPGPGPSDGRPLTWVMDRSMKCHLPSLVESIERVALETGHAGLTLVDHAGAALNGAWITQYAPAIYFKFPKAVPGGGSLWDFSASACLMKEWGRTAKDIFGHPLALNRPGSTFMNQCGILYASHNALEQGVRRVYRQRSFEGV